MNRYLVITTIRSPSKSVRSFAERSGVSLIVVGDEKTPSDWRVAGVEFISATQQKSLDYKIVKCLPWNSYARKNIGYLRALERGANIIIDSDDDNKPKEDWSFPDFESTTLKVTEDGLGFLNVYGYFSDLHIWPRGFPLKKIREQATHINDSQLNVRTVRVGVWQGLADGDPDVDAIYRLVDNRPCYFNQRAPLILGKASCCPFNSQNTAFAEPVFPLLYLPTRVSSRFTDILRGLVAQPILWHHNYHLGFTRATVVQERNPHDYLDDFKDEIECYLHTEKVMEIVEAAHRGNASIEDNLYNAYELLVDRHIVPSDEMNALELWLEDYRNIRSSIS